MTDVFKEFTLGDLLEEFSLFEIKEIAEHDYRTRGELIEAHYMDKVYRVLDRVGYRGEDVHTGYLGYFFEYVYGSVRKTGLTDTDMLSVLN